MPIDFLLPGVMKNKNGSIIKKTIKIDLEPGDGLIYLGSEIEHWREKFEGQYIVQTFLHYNDAKSKNDNLWDGRLHPGLPFDVRHKK